MRGVDLDIGVVIRVRIRSEAYNNGVSTALKVAEVELSADNTCTTVRREIEPNVLEASGRAVSDRITILGVAHA